MDDRWFEIPGKNDDLFLASRIRLLRNTKEFLFPQKMDREMRLSFEKEVEDRLNGLSSVVGAPLDKVDLNEVGKIEKDAIRERNIINEAAYKENEKTALYVSRDEAFSLTLNTTDHFRMTLSSRGENLKELLSKIKMIDAYVQDRMNYAVNDSLGFETSTLSNVGTGMRAYYIMHLPMLSQDPRFQEMINEITKYGVVIKEGWTYGARKIGGIFVLYNQRTLGLSEEEIVDILSNVGNRLMEEERALRKASNELLLRDRVLRSYGILQYAAKLEIPEACKLLSDFLLGVSEHYFVADIPVSVYELMIGIFPGNLCMYYKKSLDDDEMTQKRAQYVQAFLKHFHPSISMEE